MLCRRPGISARARARRSSGPTPSRRRTAVTLGVVVAVLFVANLLPRFGPAHASLLYGPALAAALLAFARRRGLSWDDLGLARGRWRRGAAYAVCASALVGVCYAVAAAFPATRLAFWIPGTTWLRARLCSPRLW